MNPAATVADLESLLHGTSITTLTLTTPAETITLRRQAGAAAALPTPDPARLVVGAPCCGVFLHRHPLRDAPLVEPGQRVDAGAVLGLIGVGPLLLHVAAPRAGIVATVLAPEGGLVGYGAPLVQLSDEDAA